jgi:hypothetical protein
VEDGKEEEFKDRDWNHVFSLLGRVRRSGCPGRNQGGYEPSRGADDYPKFMLQLGYDKEGLEDSQVFVFNPQTQSNLQIDFSPAGRHAKFDQKTIEWLTTTAEGSFKEEFEKEFGKGGRFTISSTRPYSLKGVPYAAKNFATYSRKGVKTEHGWIYAFAEPYQIFIIYMVLDKEGKNDHQDMKAIIDSFEYIGKK